MLASLLPLAEKIYLTSFSNSQDRFSKSHSPHLLAAYLDKCNFVHYKVMINSQQAWQAIQKEKLPIVITGSFYLVSEIYQLLT